MKFIDRVSIWAECNSGIIARLNIILSMKCLKKNRECNKIHEFLLYIANQIRGQYRNSSVTWNHDMGLFSFLPLEHCWISGPLVITNIIFHYVRDFIVDLRMQVQCLQSCVIFVNSGKITSNRFQFKLLNCHLLPFDAHNCYVASRYFNWKKLIFRTYTYIDSSFWISPTNFALIRHTIVTNKHCNTFHIFINVTMCKLILRVDFKIHRMSVTLSKIVSWTNEQQGSYKSQQITWLC